MEKFKVTDFWVSVLLIAGSVIFGLTEMDGKFIYGYFIVGGWQVISMLIHWGNKWFIKANGQRYYYHRTVFILILVFIFLFVTIQIFESPLFFILLLIVVYPLLFLSPFMAIFYTYICYEEIYIKMKRPMDLLK